MKNGVVYTPKFIVKFMLKQLKYNGIDILGKHVIDNSCGQGAFLTEIVLKYIKEYKKSNQNISGLKTHLENYIHGIEISEESHKECLKKLDLIAKKENIFDVKWDIICGDTLLIKKYDNKMDYVVGNPPYIRIHDMNRSVFKKFSFTLKGMQDMYILFFEIGINMLNPTGKLIYISPNSFYTSKAGSIMRKEIMEKNLLDSIINLGHYNPFKNATTYTAITTLSKKRSKNDIIGYYEYNGEDLKLIRKYKNKEFYINNLFYLATSEVTDLFEKTIKSYPKIVEVKNGVATNLDSFFLNFKNESRFVRKLYKISTGKFSKAFFPYDTNGNRVDFEEFEPNIKEMIIKNKKSLEKRDLRGAKFYEYARSQGIKDTQYERLCVNSILRGPEDLKIQKVEKGTVVYSGYYFIFIKKYENLIISALKGKGFFEYVKGLNKQKNGKYYFFSSNDLERYLNYIISKENNYE